MSSSVTVAIEVTDVNDNSPIFVGGPYVAEINEGLNGSSGVFLTTVLALDEDIDLNGDVQYLLLGTGVEYFSIDSESGEIRVSNLGVDFEVVSERMSNPVSLTLIAEDNGSPMRFSFSTISITITDANDNSPIFINTPYSVSLPEGIVETRQQLLIVNATDEDSTSNGVITYSLAGDATEGFDIDPTTGAMYLEAGVNLDRETNSVPRNDNGDAVLTLGVVATDGGNPPLITFTSISVLISDVNDNVPIFQSSFVNLTLSESLSVGTPILNLVATDSDFRSNGLIYYTILSEAPTNGESITENFTLGVDMITGVLTLAQPLDRETYPSFTVLIAATDQGLGNNQATATVLISVTDSNDNFPIFSIPPGGYVTTILEDTSIGTVVYNVTATDLDQGSNQVITYAVPVNNSGVTVPFSIPDPTVGMIVLSGGLDRETVSEYQVMLVARDSSQESFAILQVTIGDVNDNAPQFGSNSYSASILEGLPIGSVLQVTPPISAADPDTTPFFYALVSSGVGGGRFSIDPQTGVLITEVVLDYEETREYQNLVLMVFDESSLNSTVPLSVSVLDQNDNAPIFAPDSVTVSISEASLVGSEVYIAMATDSDDTSNGQVMYSLGEIQEFQINPLLGSVTLDAPLDFETQQSYTLEVTASDNGSPVLQGNLTLILNVLDENDNAPDITNPMPSYSIQENVRVGQLVGVVSATDADTGSNSILVFEIIAGNVEDRFYIDRETGEIFTNGTIDREERGLYSLTVEVSDSTSSPLSTQTVVTVVITDENDNTPFFPPFPQPVIPELVEPNTEVAVLSAVDVDEGNNSAITYTLMSAEPGIIPPFIIDGSSGIISTKVNLDYETTREYSLIVTASDGGDPPLSTNTFVNITLTDENDNSPILSMRSYTSTIPENTAPDSFVIRLEATDADSGSNAELVYSIVEGNIFQIDSTSGIVTVARTEPLDFEMTRIFVMQVQAEDMGSSPRVSTPSLLTVNLTDVNDNSPQFSDSQTISIEENRLPGSQVTVVTATDADQGTNAALSYTIIGGDPMGQFVVQNDGSILILSTLDYETISSYNLVIQAEDGGTPPMIGTVDLEINVIDVNDNPPVFSGTQTSYNALENIGIGAEVVRLTASDADSGINSGIVYRIVNSGELFAINSVTGSITAQQMLDRETIPQYTLLVEVSDTGSPSLSSQREITINVDDVNDNPPILTQTSFTIMENQELFSPFDFLLATDADEEENATPYYFITGGANITYLSVSNVNGLLLLITPVDYDNGETEISVDVSVTNVNLNPGPQCLPQTCSSATITIFIQDNNDNPPLFTQTDYNFNLNRSQLSPFVGNVTATDRDSLDFGLVRYMINETSRLSVALDSGMIELRRYDPKLDPKFIEVTVDAFDNLGNEPSLTSSALIKVYFIEEEDLLILTVGEEKSVVDNNLKEIMRSLDDLKSQNINVFLYDTREFVTTVEIGTANNKRQVDNGIIIRTNITIFGTNSNTKTVLNSSELFQYINEITGGQHPNLGPHNVESVESFPVTLVTQERVNVLLYVYIAIGVVGGVIVVLFLVLICVCCYCCARSARGRRDKYRPTEDAPRLKKKKTSKSEMKGYTTSRDSKPYDNPTWDDPYVNKNWSEEVDSEIPISYNERSVDGIDDSSLSRNRKGLKRGKWHNKQEFVMNDISEQNVDEVMVEIKPDEQSLSHASTTLERRSKDADKQPLFHPPSPPQTRKHAPPPPQAAPRKRAPPPPRAAPRKVRPSLDITADDDDEEESEEEEKDDMERTTSEEETEEESEEYSEEDEEYSEEDEEYSEDNEEYSEDNKKDLENDEEDSEDGGEDSEDGGEDSEDGGEDSEDGVEDSEDGGEDTEDSEGDSEGDDKDDDDEEEEGEEGYVEEESEATGSESGFKI